MSSTCKICKMWWDRQVVYRHGSETESPYTPTSSTTTDSVCVLFGVTPGISKMSVNDLGRGWRFSECQGTPFV